MYRAVMTCAAAALVLAIVPFLQTVSAVQHTIGPDLGWFGNARGMGPISPWVLYATGAAVVLTLCAVLLALILAVWSGQWLWIWGLGLLLPLGLFGWGTVVFGPLAGATLVFLPPTVAFAFGAHGWTQRRRAHSRHRHPAT